MKRKLLSCFLLLALSSCNMQSQDKASLSDSTSLSVSSKQDSNSSIDLTNLHKTTQTINIDYGQHIKDHTTLLFGYSNLFFDIKDYGIENLYAGDIVTVYYTGTMMIKDIYPGVVVLDGKIEKVEVLPADKVSLEVVPVPGGGYDILSNDNHRYILPDNYVVEPNNYYSIDKLYDGLKFMGTISKEKSSFTLDALYAIDFDESKLNNPTPSLTDDDKLNNYLNDLNNINNNAFNNDYFLTIEYTNKNQKSDENYTINIQKQENSEFFKYTSTNERYDYIIKDDKVNLYYDCIIYDDKLSSYSYKKAVLLKDFKAICNLYQNNKPLEIDKKYGNFSFNFYQIDPCCGGPAYIVIENENYNIQINLETNHYIFKDENRFVSNIDDYVPFDTYMKNLEKTSSLIKLDSDYSFLQEINPSEIDKDKYQYNPGFGIFNFYLKDNDKVIYTSYAFPDCSFSYKMCITKIEIEDKDFYFNGLTLKDSTDRISNKFLSMGFDSLSYAPIIEDTQTFIFVKNGLFIHLVTKNEENISITFFVKSTNIYNISY